MYTLTARLLPEVGAIRLMDSKGPGYEVGTMRLAGHVSGYMMLHLKNTESVRYLITDMQELVATLRKYGYKLDPDAHATTTAVIDQARAYTSVRSSTRKLDVMDLYGTRCRLVLAVDRSRIAAIVRMVPAGPGELDVRLAIYRTLNDKRTWLIHTTWITHDLTGVRKVLDVYRYELTPAAEGILMSLLTIKVIALPRHWRPTASTVTRRKITMHTLTARTLPEIDAIRLADTLWARGHGLAAEARSKVAAIVDRARTETDWGVHLFPRELDVTPPDNTGCRLVLHSDHSKIAGTVYVRPVGVEAQNVRLVIYQTPRASLKFPRQREIYAKWSTHDLVNVRQILGGYGYKLTSSAETDLASLLHT